MKMIRPVTADGPSPKRSKPDPNYDLNLIENINFSLPDELSNPIIHSPVPTSLTNNNSFAETSFNRNILNDGSLKNNSTNFDNKFVDNSFNNSQSMFSPTFQKLLNVNNYDGTVNKATDVSFSKVSQQFQHFIPNSQETTFNFQANNNLSNNIINNNSIINNNNIINSNNINNTNNSINKKNNMVINSNISNPNFFNNNLNNNAIVNPSIVNNPTMVNNNQNMVNNNPSMVDNNSSMVDNNQIMVDNNLSMINNNNLNMINNNANMSNNNNMMIINNINNNTPSSNNFDNIPQNSFNSQNIYNNNNLSHINHFPNQPPRPPLPIPTTNPSIPSTNNPNETIRKIQRYFGMLDHVTKCRQKWLTGQSSLCNYPHCSNFLSILDHSTMCTRGKECKVPNCCFFRQLVNHRKKCTNANCAFCGPLRKNNSVQLNSCGSSKDNNVNITINNNNNNLTVNNNINLPVDHGFKSNTFNNNITTFNNNIGTFNNNASINNNITINNINNLFNNNIPVNKNNTNNNTIDNDLTTNNNNINQINNTNNNQLNNNTTSNDINNFFNNNNVVKKEWHKNVTNDKRVHLIKQLIRVMVKCKNPVLKNFKHMLNIARRIESETFQCADSMQKYYDILAQKIYKNYMHAPFLQPNQNIELINQLNNTPLNKPHHASNEFIHPSSLPPSSSSVSSSLLLPNPIEGALSPSSNQNIFTSDSLFSGVVQSSNNIPPGAFNNFNSNINMSNIDNNINNINNSSMNSINNNNTNNNINNSDIGISDDNIASLNFINKNSLNSINNNFNNMNNNNVDNINTNTSTNDSSMLYNVLSQDLPPNLQSSLSLPPPSSSSLFFSSPIIIASNQTSLTSLLTPTSSGSLASAPPTSKVLKETLSQLLTPDNTPSSPSKQSTPQNKLSIKGKSVDDNNNQIKNIKSEPGTNIIIKKEKNDYGEDLWGVVKDEKIEIKHEVVDTNDHKKHVDSADLVSVFNPVLDKLWNQVPESLPFRQPVNPEKLGIPDYFNIVKEPIDLSTMRSKLESGLYEDGWSFVFDVHLMCNNAWLYNKKSSKVYKFCTKLWEMFEGEIDAAMKSLGYCCGQLLTWTPQALCCYAKQLCSIPRDASYYHYDNKYTYCEKCFNDVTTPDILVDDPSQPALRICKSDFLKDKNDKLEREPFVACSKCGRKMHKLCVLYYEGVSSAPFVCTHCTTEPPRPNKYTAKNLPTTKLGNFIENRVNQYLKKKDSGSTEVAIRVLSSVNRTLEVGKQVKSRFKDCCHNSLSYKVKTVFAFVEIGGTEVCFFGMHVQEYPSECPPPNHRRLYIAYLDSVNVFQPRQHRTAVYHEILLSYLHYARSLGFLTAHIWACPPSEGDDYIFHCHPSEQKIPKPKRLQEWYRRMLDRAVDERVVVEYKDILQDAVDGGLECLAGLPYFEGDFWPTILEEMISEVRAREEGEEDVDEDSLLSKPAPSDKRKPPKKNSKKRPKNRTQASSSSHSDLLLKLMGNMEKYKEVFFVVHLQNDVYPHNQHQHPPCTTPSSLLPIVDPDPPMNTDLMDGRDAFLTLCRERHLEFSSLRRAKYSTMVMLCELHGQMSESSLSSACHRCKASVETRYHCEQCGDYDLCLSCYPQVKHPHKMTKVGLGLDGRGEGEGRKTSLQKYEHALLHASSCRNGNCRMGSCLRMKQLIAHMNKCAGKAACGVCSQIKRLCLMHARNCREVGRCFVPRCDQIRRRLEQKRTNERLQHDLMVRRRIQNMRHHPSPVSAIADEGEADNNKNPTPSPAHKSANMMSEVADADVMRQMITPQKNFSRTQLDSQLMQQSPHLMQQQSPQQMRQQHFPETSPMQSFEIQAPNNISDNFYQGMFPSPTKNLNHLPEHIPSPQMYSPSHLRPEVPFPPNYSSPNKQRLLYLQQQQQYQQQQYIMMQQGRQNNKHNQYGHFNQQQYRQRLMMQHKMIPQNNNSYPFQQQPQQHLQQFQNMPEMTSQQQMITSNQQQKQHMMQHMVSQQQYIQQTQKMMHQSQFIQQQQLMPTQQHHHLMPPQQQSQLLQQQSQQLIQQPQQILQQQQLIQQQPSHHLLQQQLLPPSQATQQHKSFPP